MIKVEGPDTFSGGQTTDDEDCVVWTVGVYRSPHQRGMLNSARALLLRTLLALANILGYEHKHLPASEAIVSTAHNHPMVRMSDQNRVPRCYAVFVRTRFKDEEYGT